MQKNFLIGSMGAEMVVERRTIDLHNLYSTKSIGADPTGFSFKMEFQRDHRWEGPEGLPEVVTLSCSKKLSIAFNDPAQPPGPFSEEAVEIAYFDADCEWDAFLDEGLPASQGFAGLHVSFSGGLVLRIRCKVAEATLRF